MSSCSEQSLIETETLVWSATLMNADQTDVFGEGLGPVFQFQANVRFPSVILTKICVCIYILYMHVRFLPANTTLFFTFFLEFWAATPSKNKSIENGTTSEFNQQSWWKVSGSVY